MNLPWRAVSTSPAFSSSLMRWGEGGRRHLLAFLQLAAGGTALAGADLLEDFNPARLGQSLGDQRELAGGELGHRLKVALCGKGYKSGDEAERLLPALTPLRTLGSQFSPSRVFQEMHRPCRAKIGGAKRDRTADLLHAMQALSQLSYGPVPNANRPGNRSDYARLA